MTISIFEYEIFKGIAEALEEAFGLDIPQKLVASFFFGVIFCSFIYLILKLIIKPIIKNKKWRNRQLEILLKGYEHYSSRKERRLYIRTGFQQLPPNEKGEPYDAQFEDDKNDAINFFINRVFVKNNESAPLYIILGGSGMGKTTFVVQLVTRYIKKFKETTIPFNIKLLYCGEIFIQDRTSTLIAEIKDFKPSKDIDTILILDALDENSFAIENFDSFFSELQTHFNKFRFVLLTCRTHFFDSEKAEPDNSILRDPQTKGLIKYKKYYISPLNDDEIKKYLNKKYRFQFRKRRRAFSIAENAKKLMARPLLLSYIDDIVESNQPNLSIAEIYKILIDKWLDREVEFVQVDNKEQYKKDLYDFSIEIASRLMESQESQNIDDIVAKYSDTLKARYSNIENKGRNYLKVRSLLNRDGNHYKFAHKSFMEYFFAKKIFDSNSFELIIDKNLGFDMVTKFLISMVNSGMRKIKNIVVDNDVRIEFFDYSSGKESNVLPILIINNTNDDSYDIITQFNIIKFGYMVIDFQVVQNDILEYGRLLTRLNKITSDFLSLKILHLNDLNLYENFIYNIDFILSNKFFTRGLIFSFETREDYEMFRHVFYNVFYRKINNIAKEYKIELFYQYKGDRCRLPHLIYSPQNSYHSK